MATTNGAGSLVDEANAGNTEAMTRLGVHHLMGSHGAARSPDEALRWFNRARSGDGLFCVGCYCYDGLGGAARDPNKAVSVWTTAAVLGSGAAMARLGWCYQHGVGVECDKPRAVELYAAAIAKSSELHSWRLGVCYLRGEGVGRDLGLAAELIQQSAGGDEDALAYLGWCYLWGCGVGMDLEKAVELLTSASSTLDNCKAKVFLGYCHERGIGVALDTNKARELFHEANTRPGTEALGEIGEYCLKGDCGAPTDKRAAVGYLEMGAEAGDPVSMYHLGVCLRDGVGVDCDVEQSHHWLVMAAQLGHRGAAKILISAISSSSLLSHKSAEQQQVEALTKQVESLKEQLAHSEEKVESLRKKVAELQKEKEDDWHDEP